MKLVERRKEFSGLSAMLDSCAAGQSGVALVSGPIASGKTVLLRAFGDSVAESGALFLSATGSSAERGLPFGVMGQLLLGADLPPAERDLAMRLLDSPEAAKVIPKLCGILLDQARERPVVLSVDDVGHADVLSREALLSLARRLGPRRLLLVLGDGSSLLADDPLFRIELLRQQRCRHIRLAPLSPQGVAELLADALGAEVARLHALDFHRLSGGNPLLLRALIEDHTGAAFHAGEHEEVTQRSGPTERESGPSEHAERFVVPGAAFARAVTSCLYRGDPPLRRMAQAAAVLGRRGSPEALAEVLRVSLELAERGLGSLTEIGLMDDSGFRHELGRLTVLKGLVPPRRARLEARVAKVLHDRGEPATVVARHLTAAEPIEAPWPLLTLLEAADRYLAAGEAEPAVHCLRSARELCPDERQDLAIRMRLVRSEWRLNPAGAAWHLPELTAAALSGRLDGPDARSLIGYLLWAGRVDDARQVLDVVEARPGQTAPGDLEFVRVLMSRGYPGLPGAVRDGGPQIPVNTLAPALDPNHRAAALLSAVLGRNTGGDAMIRAEQILQGTRVSDGSLTAALAALFSLLLTDNHAKAGFWCDVLVTEAADRRAPTWQALFAAARALIDLRLGRLGAAERAAGTALEVLSPEGWGPAVALPLGAMVYTLTARNDFQEAGAYLSVPVPEAAFQSPAGAFYLWARGHYYLAAGRPYAALDDFHACGDLLGGWDMDVPALIAWRVDAARAFLALGKVEQARACVDEQLVTLGAGDAWTRGAALRLRAATMPPEHRIGALDQAVEVLAAQGGHRLELARALEDLAEAHRVVGGTARAEVLAAEARRLVAESGAWGPARDPGERDAPPDGRSPRPAPSPGTTELERRAEAQPGDLSDAELRVARLAVRGHTNRQIAGRLCITVSTVEQHLTRVYRKLDIKCRADLAAKFENREAPAGAPPGIPDGARPFSPDGPALIANGHSFQRPAAVIACEGNVSTPVLEKMKEERLSWS
ncbi:AAA family ATPase [Spirillospora sp. NPDC052269]